MSTTPKAPHTPGPWVIERGERFQIVGQQPQPGDCVWSEPVCKTYRTVDPLTEHANARLIAAAPELYEALRGLTRAYVEMTDALDPEPDESPVTSPELERARAVLAKIAP